MKHIFIGRDFSETPLGRYPEDGEFSGERFREDILVPALKSSDKVAVTIDDAEGYGSSFLEEAFGGVVRKAYFNPSELRQRLLVSCNDPDYAIYRDLIWKYIEEAKPNQVL